MTWSWHGIRLELREKLNTPVSRWNIVNSRREGHVSQTSSAQAHTVTIRGVISQNKWNHHRPKSTQGNLVIFADYTSSQDCTGGYKLCLIDTSFSLLLALMHVRVGHITPVSSGFFRHLNNIVGIMGKAGVANSIIALFFLSIPGWIWASMHYNRTLKLKLNGIKVSLIHHFHLWFCSCDMSKGLQWKRVLLAQISSAKPNQQLTDSIRIVSLSKAWYILVLCAVDFHCCSKIY